MPPEYITIAPGNLRGEVLVAKRVAGSSNRYTVIARCASAHMADTITRILNGSPTAETIYNIAVEDSRRVKKTRRAA